MNRKMPLGTTSATVARNAIAGAAGQCRSVRGRNCGGSSLTATTLAVLADRVAIYKAARAVHRSPAFVLSLVNSGLLKAYRRGGPVKRPWLAVDLSELLAVIDRETLYVPPAMIGRRALKPRISKADLHPMAAAM
jgi:hypothetical protein